MKSKIGKRKRSYRRKSYARKKAKVSPTLRRAVKSIVKSNIETKEFVANDSNVNVNEDTILCYNPLYPVVQGSGDYQRIGNRIRLQKIVMTGIMSNGSNAAANNPQPGHLCVWFIRTPTMQVANTLTGNFNTLSTTNEELMFDNSTASLPIPSIMLHPNRKRGVQVLMKRVYHWTPVLTVGSGLAAPTSKTFIWTINLKNSPFLFEENNTGFQTKYNYYFLVSGFIQNPGTLNPTVQNIRWECRTYFKDA